VRRTWILGEFLTPEALVAATSQLREQGHMQLDTFTPYPVAGVPEAMALPKSRVPMIAFVCGALGVGLGYWFQWYTGAIAYPLVVGNRPIHSVPSYVPITFELMVLFAAFGIFFGMLALWRLPQPYHPVFEVDAFRSASSTGFWVGVRANDMKSVEMVSNALKQRGARQISLVDEATH
jgi:hypothetical protein